MNKHLKGKTMAKNEVETKHEPMTYAPDKETEVLRAIAYCQRNGTNKGTAVDKTAIKKHLEATKVPMSLDELDDCLWTLLAAHKIRVANKLWMVAIVALALFGCGSNFSSASTDGVAGQPSGTAGTAGQTDIAGSPGSPPAGGGDGGAAGAWTASGTGGTGTAGQPSGTVGGGDGGAAGAWTASGTGGTGTAGSADTAGRPGTGGMSATGGNPPVVCPPCGDGVCGTCTTPEHPDCAHDTVFIYCF